MALADLDRKLLDECLERKPRSWEDFVDRYLGLVIHVVQNTAEARQIQIASADRDDLVADVFLAIVEHDFAVLRRFKRESSLSTYLTVIARRVVVRELLKRRTTPLPSNGKVEKVESNGHDHVADQEQVERLLGELHGPEANVVRLFYLEGKSYHEISRQTGVAENTIGPMLSRARAKMKTVSA